MSKLADAIRRSQRVEAAPMGFGTARRVATPTMLVGFRGPVADLAAASANADLLLIEVSGGDLDGGRLKEMRSSAKDLPFGVLPKATPAIKPGDLRAAGLDFLAFEPESTPASVLLDDDMGYVLILPDQSDDMARDLFLRSLEPLTLEALYINGVPSSLTVSQQIALARVGLITRKPLISQVQPEISSEDLQCLRAAGVVALVVDSPEGVTRVKESVAALPARRQRKDDRPVVSLPRGQAPPEDDDDDD
ncbi:MAG TPA: hypothetical protein VG845_10845 [Dehalococcoidia bacterium]|nr:hypothetical protein [Dehalococcoidia bacterium]